MVGRYKDMPTSEGAHMSEMDGEKIMHISLPISKQTVLMGSDIGGEWAKHSVEGNNIQISINSESEEEAKKFLTGCPQVVA